MKKAISIEIKWDDGSISKAEGDAAARIMEWYGSCETMSCIHGAQYLGPHFTVIPNGLHPENDQATPPQNSGGSENKRAK